MPFSWASGLSVKLCTPVQGIVFSQASQAYCRGRCRWSPQAPQHTMDLWLNLKNVDTDIVFNHAGQACCACRWGPRAPQHTLLMGVWLSLRMWTLISKQASQVGCMCR